MSWRARLLLVAGAFVGAAIGIGYAFFVAGVHHWALRGF